MVNLDRLLDLPRITQLGTPTLAYGDGIVPDPDDPGHGSRWLWLALLLGHPPPTPPVNTSRVYRRFRDVYPVSSATDWLRSELAELHRRPGRVLRARLTAYRPGRGAAQHEVFVHVPPHHHARGHLNSLLESLNARSHVRDHGITIRGHLTRRTEPS